MARKKRMKKSSAKKLPTRDQIRQQLKKEGLCSCESCITWTLKDMKAGRKTVLEKMKGMGW